MNETPNRSQSMGQNANKGGAQPQRHNPEGRLQTMGTRGGGGTDNVPVGRSTTHPPSGEITEDRRTGTTEALQDAPTQNGPLAQMHRLIERAGEEAFPSDIIRILAERVDDSLVDIRPDGLIFVSHPHYRDRLDRAFGVGGWALVPLAAPKVSGNRVIYYGFLKARGQYIADAFGGAEYYPQNRMGNFDNSAEAAKSDCLVRCCKALPMFRECWDKEYADYWKSTYAEQVRANGGRGDLIWRKKGEAKRGFSARPERDPESEFRKLPRVEDENNAHIEAIRSEGKLLIASRDVHNENEPGYDENERLREEYESFAHAAEGFVDDGREDF